MKKLIFLTLLFLSISLISFSQLSIPLSFKVSEEAKVSLGTEWDFEYTPLRNSIDIKFDGKTLNMINSNGSVFWNTEVEKYEIKESTDNGEIIERNFILLVKYNGFLKYVVIENKKIFDDWFSEIKIPYLTKTGETFSYSYYQ